MNDLPHQRSEGAIRMHWGTAGLITHREEGCLKLRLPQGAADGIIINTSGGLTGGDKLKMHIELASQSTLALTSQAAERVYRSLGPSAQVACDFTLAEGASLFWLPQETILYDRSAFARKMNINLGRGATFLAVETFVLGRKESDEQINSLALRDEWNIYRDGHLCHAERLALGPTLPRTQSTLAKAGAFATVLLIAEHAEHVARDMQIFAGSGAVSCWNGKLVARLVAEDGFQLRKGLKKVLSACLQGRPLPRNWEL